MKRGLRVLLTLAVLASMAALHPRSASADPVDAGDGGTAADSGSSDDGGPGATATPPVPLACDGSLCDTTNESTCTASSQRGGAPTDPASVTAVVGVLAVAIVRRRRPESRS
jgi:hypothetical protein